MKLPLAPNQEELLLGYNAHHLPVVSMRNIHQIGSYMEGFTVRKFDENLPHGMVCNVYWIKKGNDTNH